MYWTCTTAGTRTATSTSRPRPRKSRSQFLRIDRMPSRTAMAAMHVVARSMLIAMLLVGCGSTSLSSPKDASTGEGDASTGGQTSAEPPLERMSLAHAVSEKISVPVDVRYEFDGSPSLARTATLNLAFVP